MNKCMYTHIDIFT